MKKYQPIQIHLQKSGDQSGKTVIEAPVCVLVNHPHKHWQVLSSAMLTIYGLSIIITLHCLHFLFNLFKFF